MLSRSLHVNGSYLPASKPFRLITPPNSFRNRVQSCELLGVPRHPLLCYDESI
jgi:hypothetical protein